jgi:MFS family permease
MYLQAALGPLTLLLQGPLHLSYVEVSLPTAAFALGVILVGLTGGRVLAAWKYPVQHLLWLCGSAVALGAIFLIISANILFLVGSTFFMGMFSGLMQCLLQARLAEHHQERRTIALTEANVMASAGAVLAPLFIGGFQSTGAGWRLAILCAPTLFVGSALYFRRMAVPREASAARERPVASGSFPLAFWLYWLVLICSVAVEWSIIVWSALTLEKSGVPVSVATMLVSLFFVAEMGGRLLGSRVARRASGPALLLTSLALTALGFGFFWLCPLAVVKIGGLLLAGLGVANLYPLSLAIALGTVPGRMGVASARLSLGGGLATLAAPLALGWLAGQLGIQLAYGIIPLLLALAVTLTVLANRLNLRSVRTTPVSIEALVESQAS